jgi:hypothetical protein
LAGNCYIFQDYYRNSDLSHMGRLEGEEHYKSDPAERALLEELQGLPKGILIESDPQLGSPALVVATFTANYTLCGAPWEEVQKRVNRNDLFTMEADIKSFYAGGLTDPDSWLTGVTAGGVTYAVWQARDNEKAPGAWAKINSAIEKDYTWTAISSDPKNPIGFWTRKGPPPEL